jgi:hypothetical protein
LAILAISFLPWIGCSSRRREDQPHGREAVF